MSVHPLAGKIAPFEAWVNIPRLISAYYANKPDNIVNMQVISDAELKIGVDPMGGSGIYFKIDQTGGITKENISSDWSRSIRHRLSRPKML